MRIIQDHGSGERVLKSRAHELSIYTSNNLSFPNGLWIFSGEPYTGISRQVSSESATLL